MNWKASSLYRFLLTASLLFTFETAEGQAPSELSRLFETLVAAEEGKVPEDVKEHAQEQLTQILEQDIRPWLPGFLNILNSDNAKMRDIAARVLGIAGLANYESGQSLMLIADELVPYLEDSDPNIRESIARALASILPRPPSTLAAPLRKLLHDSERNVRLLAMEGLSRIRPVEPETLEAVLEIARKDKSEEVKGQALRALGELGVASGEVVNLLVANLEAPNQFIRTSAAHGLALLGPAAREAIPKLRELAEDENESEVVRSNARGALRLIENPEEWYRVHGKRREE